MPSASDAPRIVAVLGGQEFFAERAISAFESSWRSRDAEIRPLSAATDGLLNELLSAASPDLFGGRPAIVLRDFESLDERTGNAVLDQIQADDEAAWLVAHAGGRGSTKVRVRLEKLALAVVKAEPLKGKGVMEFVQREFRGHAKTADDDTMALLIDAIGNDPRGLASAVSQLSSDIESKHVGREQAALYYSGHVEVKGYQIADAVANRDRTAALESLRFALVEGGTRAGLMTITAVAGNLRRLALAKSAVGGNPAAEVASVLRIPEWMARTSVRQAHRWTSDDIAQAVELLADLSVQLKGGLDADQALSDEQKQYVLQQAIATMAGDGSPHQQ